MPKELIIRKANDLIEARYKLTLIQQRIILYLNAQINAWDKEFITYSIKVSDFCEYIGIDPKNIYEDFIKISEGLIAKTLVIGKGNSVTVTSWLSAATYHIGKGVIELKFSSELKDFLLDLNKKYTKYFLDDVKRFKCIYSYRIYELLLQYYNKNEKEKTFFVDELKEMFGIKDVYPYYANFKKKVLLEAQQELFEKSDICFDFVEIKKGRKIDRIRFIINANIKPDAADVEEGAMKAGEAEGLELVEELRPNPEFTPELPFIEERLTPAQRLAIYKAAGGDMGLIKSRYESMKDKPNVRDLVGYLIKVLQLPGEEYGSPVKPASGRQGLVPKNRFINFQQREIDFEELERLELEQLKERIRNH